MAYWCSLFSSPRSQAEDHLGDCTLPRRGLRGQEDGVAGQVQGKDQSQLWGQEGEESCQYEIGSFSVLVKILTVLFLSAWKEGLWEEGPQGGGDVPYQEPHAAHQLRRRAARYREFKNLDIKKFICSKSVFYQGTICYVSLFPERNICSKHWSTVLFSTTN